LLVGKIRMFMYIVTLELPARGDMGVGVEAGNLLKHTRSTVASSCGEKLPAKRQGNDVAGNSGIR
jgi:hypothetical protein